ncbi:MAG: MotA/TolQ/ExbB proton channel family protein [Opitutales bacterium]|nr:MotA/TolQ/ExbB proton channel family protein [Opitutales bacterium]
MRLFFILLCAMFSSVVFAQSQMMAVAKGELQKANDEYKQVLENSQKLITQKQMQFEIICKQIADANKKIAQLEREVSEVSNLKDKYQFYKNISSELASELYLICDDNSDRCVSATEVLALTKAQLQDQLKLLKKPLVLESVKAIEVKSRSQINGSSFRIGGFRYFVSKDVCGFLSEKNVVYGKEYSQAIRDFVEGKVSSIPVDLSFGELQKRERNTTTILENIQKGGIWMYPILFLGALSLIVFIVKSGQLLLASRSAYRRELLKSLSKKVASELSSDEKDDVIFNFVSTQNLKLKNWLSVLSISAAVSPLFGLLGTVSGIIKTFAELSTIHGGVISDGIAEALITTEYGLIVAIPALIANAILSRKVKNITEALRSSAVEKYL